MSLPYTDKDLAPQSTSSFRTWGGGHGFDVADLINPGAVAAIGETFATANLAHEAWQYAEREGRLDVRRAWRNHALGDMDIFKDRRSPSASDVRLIVLVDASGSMGATDAKVRTTSGDEEFIRIARDEAAAIFSATMVAGMSILPNVKIEVIQHDFGYSTAEGGRARRASTSRHTVNLRRAWEEGTPIQYMNQMPNWRPGGGNADGHAIRAVAEYLKQDCLPDEVPMIVVISDGAPADIGKNPDWGRLATENGVGGRWDGAGAALKDAVNLTRKEGIEVLSVAIAGGDQTRYYGPDHVVRFDGDWVTLAQALAALVGEKVATSYQQGADDPFAF